MLQFVLFAPRLPPSFLVSPKMYANSMSCGVVVGVWGGRWVLLVSGRELPAPSVLATCLENIQIACVICKPLSHPGGSYITCHYPGGPSRHSIVIISYGILLPGQGKPDPTLYSTSLPFPDKRTSRTAVLGMKNVYKVSDCVKTSPASFAFTSNMNVGRREYLAD